MVAQRPKRSLDLPLWLVGVILLVPFFFGWMIASSTPEVAACMDRVSGRAGAFCIVYDLQSWAGIRNLLVGTIVTVAIPGFFILKDFAEGGPQKRRHRRELDRARRAKKRTEREALKLATQKNSKGA